MKKSKNETFYSANKMTAWKQEKWNMQCTNKNTKPPAPRDSAQFLQYLMKTQQYSLENRVPTNMQERGGENKNRESRSV